MNVEVHALVEHSRLIIAGLAAIALGVWVAGLALVPDPRPLSAPAPAVRLARSVSGVSEPAARLAVTLGLRAVGVGVIGVLMALVARPLPIGYAAPLVLLATPILAVLAKWINFGYMPIRPQLAFIAAFAVLGALAGLALRRSWIAGGALAALATGLVAWGASTGVPDDLDTAWRQTALHVMDHADDIPDGDAGFRQAMRIAFLYAEENAHGTDAVLPNRAAILALGVILGDDRIARIGRREIDCGPPEARRRLRDRIRLRDRNDLARHFWVSAALTVLSDADRSYAVGLGKETMDSLPGGSGFSFVDMAANKAGIRFATAVTRDDASAHAVHLRIARGLEADDLLPDVADLPEGITADALRDDFGGLGGPETKRLLAEIDRRLERLSPLR